MKKFLKPYRHLALLFAAVMFVIALFALGLPVIHGVGLFALFQFSQFAMSKRPGYCFNTVLTPEQIKEFEKICGELKDFGSHIPALRELAAAEGGFAAIKKLPDLLKAEQKRVDELQGDLKKLRKQAAMYQGTTGLRWIGGEPYVTDDVACALTSTFIVDACRMGEKGRNALNIGKGSSFDAILGKACDYLGIEQKAALDATSTPLPTIYVPQIIELVFAYGQARKFGTVFPLGAGTVKLPRLKAGEDAFAYLGVGTAGMSQAVGEKKVTAELVTFTANKMGGLIRIPTEIEEDTFIPLGQFLARYISRQLAQIEDKTMFIGDGTGTYANITGVGPYCAANVAYLQQLAAGKTKPTDAQLGDFRAMRALVNPAVLANMAASGQTMAAYYMHPTLEALLVTFNTIGSPLVYRPMQGAQPATLDGFPIRWIGVSQAYKTTAAANAYLAFFGDLSYWYLGERGAPRVEISREVFFATDELAMRALERIDVEAMAIDAMSSLQTAAA